MDTSAAANHQEWPAGLLTPVLGVGSVTDPVQALICSTNTLCSMQGFSLALPFTIAAGCSRTQFCLPALPKSSCMLCICSLCAPWRNIDVRRRCRLRSFVGW